MATDQKVLRRQKLRWRIRTTISGTATTPRLSVFRSNKAIYLQLIDDKTGHTIVAANTRDTSITSGTNVERSQAAGKLLAERAVAAGVDKCVFDRGGYLYHGRVKAVADGAREGGLKF